jgi:hypothetical protein
LKIEKSEENQRSGNGSAHALQNMSSGYHINAVYFSGSGLRNLRHEQNIEKLRNTFDG